MEITKGENANLAGMEPRCPKCGGEVTWWITSKDCMPVVRCRAEQCDEIFRIKELSDFAQFFRSPAPTPPLDVEGWKRPEDSLPDDDSDVLAAIWWEHVANPEESSYSIHDCAYYEGGEGSGQKIFTDCEGEEFEAKEIAFWIYKKDLAASLLRRHIASPAPQPWPHKAGGIIDAWDGLSNDCASDPDLEALGRLINQMRKEIEESDPASPAQPEKRDEKACEVCGETEMLTVMGRNQYACPKHRAVAPQSGKEGQ